MGNLDSCSFEKIDEDENEQQMSPERSNLISVDVENLDAKNGRKIKRIVSSTKNVAHDAKQ